MNLPFLRLMLTLVVMIVLLKTAFSAEHAIHRDLSAALVIITGAVALIQVTNQKINHYE